MYFQYTIVFTHFQREGVTLVKILENMEMHFPGTQSCDILGVLKIYWKHLFCESSSMMTNAQQTGKAQI